MLQLVYFVKVRQADKYLSFTTSQKLTLTEGDIKIALFLIVLCTGVPEAGAPAIFASRSLFISGKTPAAVVCAAKYCQTLVNVSDQNIFVSTNDNYRLKLKNLHENKTFY